MWLAHPGSGSAIFPALVPFEEPVRTTLRDEFKASGSLTLPRLHRQTAVNSEHLTGNILRFFAG
jgi:hypothetical protein